MSGRLDFQAIKADYPIEQVAERLGIALKPHGAQLRGPCFSGQGDDRALVVTPARRVWYSHPLKKGGDVIELVSVMKDVSAKDAAAWIAGTQQPEKSATGRTPNAEFKPVELVHDHPSVLVSGLEADDAKRFGVGYKAKAAGAGHILVPVYADGKLSGYVGCQEITWIPERWRA
jgi:hypothetical protein